MFDAEVFQLALTWITRCKCVEQQKPKTYPTRLIDLSDLRAKGYIDPKTLEYHGDSGVNGLLNTKVRLIETKDINMGEVKNNFYVTLSHKWGSIKEKEPVKLNKERKKDFERGLKLRNLPRTFQDAVLFAVRLPRVGYIWIDSLCIMQDVEDNDDWLKESALSNHHSVISFILLGCLWSCKT